MLDSFTDHGISKRNYLIVWTTKVRKNWLIQGLTTGKFWPQDIRAISMIHKRFNASRNLTEHYLCWIKKESQEKHQDYRFRFTKRYLNPPFYILHFMFFFLAFLRNDYVRNVLKAINISSCTCTFCTLNISFFQPSSYLQEYILLEHYAKYLIHRLLIKIFFEHNEEK